MNVYIPIIAAIAGAILATALTYLVQQARPLVLVDVLRTTALYSSETAGIDPDRELLDALADYEVQTGAEGLSGISMTEKHYTDVLLSAHGRLEQEVNVRLPALTESAQNLRMLLMNNDFTLVDRLLGLTDAELFGAVAVAAMRRSFSLPDPGPDYSQLTKYHNVVVLDEKQMVVVALPGPRNIVFSWGSTPTAQIPLVKNVALRLANSVAYRRPEDLLAVADFVRERTPQRLQTATNLRARAQTELRPYLRLTVEGVVVNRGRTAVSITNRAKLIVAMKGYRSAESVIVEDVSVDLTLGSNVHSGYKVSFEDPTSEMPSGLTSFNRPDFSTPLLVPPGGSVRYICLSNDPASKFPESKDLLRAFDGANQQCYIALLAIGKGRQGVSAIYSRDVLFRDFAQHTEIPPKSR